MNLQTTTFPPTTWPKISVVTPSFNQGRYIRETIESVLAQTYPNLEYLIIDGGSTDETLSVVEEYRDRIAYFVSEKDNGQSHAINKGFNQASGEILCWLNSDDQFAPDAVWAAALGLMTSRADMVAGICEVFEDGLLVHRHLTSCADGELPLNDMLDLDNGWNAGQFFYQPEVFFTQDLWERAGSHVREDCFYSMDYELWCRFALAKAKIHVIGTPLVAFRTHADQKTADPRKFKTELARVRDDFCREHGVAWSGSRRPNVNWSRKLRIALINNLGYLYGAGIAHMRIAASFELAGHDVSSFDLLTSGDDLARLVEEVADYEPDLVVFGNLHANNSVPIEILRRIQEMYPCFWVTHDFWLITGRCGYMGDCQKFISGCDHSCPTYREYPMLSPDSIKAAWVAKREVIETPRQLTILANSRWASEVYSGHLNRVGSDANLRSIRLGVPTDVFFPQDRRECREKLGIPSEQFVIAFSVSSLSDSRKGGHLLVAALGMLDMADTTILLIGNMDEEFNVNNANLLSLGYVDDVRQLAVALNTADIYVGPSTEETFGQVYVEAAMCGTPSVGFDCTGVRDAIIDGVTGVTVKEVSAKALADAIYCLYCEREVLESYRITAALYAQNEHSLESSYHSFFRALDDNGLIDRWGVAHKIELGKSSHIASLASVGSPDKSRAEKSKRTLQRYSRKMIDALPKSLKAAIARGMPNWLERRIIRWLLR